MQTVNLKNFIKHHFIPFAQGAGGILCKWKHIQGEVEALFHQKPKVK